MSITIQIAERESERERVFRLRYDVHAVELGKGGTGVDHERQRLTDDADRDAIIVYAEDEGRLVGTIRLNIGHGGGLPAFMRETYGTAALEKVLGAHRLSVTSRFVVDPAYRGRTLASLLVLKLYEIGLGEGVLADYCMCEVPLLRSYYRLGYREYRDGVRPDGVGLRVPLLLCVQDREHLQRLASPFAWVLPEAVGDGGRTARAAQQVYPNFRTASETPEADLRTLWAQIAEAMMRRAAPRPSLLDGFNAEELETIFSRGADLHFLPQQLVQPGQERRAGLGVLLSGQLGVGLKVGEAYHWLEMLQPGDVFGEPTLPPAAGRASDLVSLASSRAVMLPPDLIDRLHRDHAQLAARLSRNLIEVLRQRVDDLHRRSAEWVRRERTALVRDFTIPPLQEAL